MNWRWSDAEVAAAIDLTQPTLLLADEACVQLACSAQARAAHGTQLLLLDTTAPIAPAAAAAPAALANPSALIGLEHSGSGRSRGTSSHPPSSLQELLTVAAAAHQAAAPSQQQQQQQLRPKLQLLQPHTGAAAGAALICFTSGTTGASKGAVLSHASIMHQSMAKLAVVQYSCDDVYLHVAPLFHIGGLSSAFAVLLAGGAHVFMPR
jgi:acyl-CoA synthetase (AMP-forming)/AMP-acid ligase II